MARLNEWTLTGLHTFNRDIMAGRRKPGDMVNALNQAVLPELPPARELSIPDAQRMLVHLGFYGASVARHHQEHDPALKDRPNVPLDGLVVGAARTQFRAYFASVADHTGTGHPHRDTYASISRWNTPTAEVYWQGERIERLPGLFDDGRTRTYVGDPGEVAFFNLVKKSEALELAANRLLTPIADGAVSLFDPEALWRVQRATVLLAVIHRLNLEFAAQPPESGLRPDFFLDTMRQFAVHWTVGDVPPSGAQDPEYLIRDFLVGINFPGYDQHVRKVFPALLDEERETLTRLMGSRSIPDLLLDQLKLDQALLDAMTTAEIIELVRRHPIVAACCQLLFINFRIASSHLMLSKKFLFKPAVARERAGIPDNLLVSRWAGTTGMVERLLEHLTRARKEHCLSAFSRISNTDLSTQAGIQQLPAIATDDVAGYVRLWA